MRIASLLPAATEIVYALGLGESLVGVTHECDYPEAAKRLPRLTSSLLPPGLTSAEIDAAVSSSLRDEHTVYALDAALLRGLEPDFVLTQSLCEVCAVPRADVDDAVCTMPEAATIISLDPSSLEDMLNDMLRLAACFGMQERGPPAVGLKPSVPRRLPLPAHACSARSGSTRSSAAATGSRKWSRSRAARTGSACPMSIQRGSDGTPWSNGRRRSSL
jgi:hypothetical protein